MTFFITVVEPQLGPVVVKCMGYSLEGITFNDKFLVCHNQERFSKGRPIIRLRRHNHFIVQLSVQCFSLTYSRVIDGVEKLV